MFFQDQAIISKMQTELQLLRHLNYGLQYNIISTTGLRQAPKQIDGNKPDENALKLSHAAKCALDALPGDMHGDSVYVNKIILAAFGRDALITNGKPKEILRAIKFSDKLKLVRGIICTYFIENFRFSIIAEELVVFHTFPF